MDQPFMVWILSQYSWIVKDDINKKIKWQPWQEYNDSFKNITLW